MDYSATAAELYEKMRLLHNASLQKSIDEAIHGECFVLNYIARREAEVLPGEIVGEMNVSSARIAQILNNIESKGLITRRIDKSDRRRILVELTPEGRKTAAEDKRNIMEMIEKTLSLLGEEDAGEYVRITGKLADIFSRHEEIFRDRKMSKCPEHTAHTALTEGKE